MTEEEAYRNCERYTKTKDRSEEDNFLYEESLKFLIAKSKDPQYLLVSLGLHYGDLNRYDLAKNCFEKALEQDNVYAWLNLGHYRRFLSVLPGLMLKMEPGKRH